MGTNKGFCSQIEINMSVVRAAAIHINNLSSHYMYFHTGQNYDDCFFVSVVKRVILADFYKSSIFNIFNLFSFNIAYTFSALLLLLISSYLRLGSGCISKNCEICYAYN